MDAIAQLQNYHLTEKLYEGSRTIVYRGLCKSDQRPVVIKFLKNEFPSFHELVQFGHQYSIAKDLNLPNIVKPLALVPCGRASALVMEDFGGCDLKQFLKVSLNQSGADLGSSSGDLPIRLGDRPEHLILFLQIALQVAEALEGLSHHRIIHRDIKPANILIHPQSHQVKLIDFSIAAALPLGAQSLQNAPLLEGTRAYLSPEQTGRMNSGVDCRSDFYAFGVTCYELLTGQLPFTATDPMKMVHGHLAKQPVPPHELCLPTLPRVLSDWVLKLMAKNTENRYQSAFGLKKDLQRCLYELKKTVASSPLS